MSLLIISSACSIQKTQFADRPYDALVSEDDLKKANCNFVSKEDSTGKDKYLSLECAASEDLSILEAQELALDKFVHDSTSALRTKKLKDVTVTGVIHKRTLADTKVTAIRAKMTLLKAGKATEKLPAVESEINITLNSAYRKILEDQFKCSFGSDHKLIVPKKLDGSQEELKDILIKFATCGKAILKNDNNMIDEEKNALDIEVESAEARIKEMSR